VWAGYLAGSLLPAGFSRWKQKAAPHVPLDDLPVSHNYYTPQIQFGSGENPEFRLDEPRLEYT
jgi:hypothetical protein